MRLVADELAELPSPHCRPAAPGTAGSDLLDEADVLDSHKLPGAGGITIFYVRIDAMKTPLTGALAGALCR